MHELGEQEIEQISLDIDQQGLTFTPLKNELLDHICCQVEEEMEHGMTFNGAYRKVQEAMGKKRIRQIQDETLTFISKKYRRMKRTMYALGVAAPIILISAAIFKIFHWPGAGMLITVALIITGIFFLPVFVMVRIRDTRRQDEPVPVGLYLTGMIAGILTIVGTLFKVQHWPGASIMLTLGLAGTALAFLPMYAAYRIKESREKNLESNKRIWIGGTIAGILLILGALFKIMHWPGAGIVLISSWSLVAVILLPYLVLNQLKQEKNRVTNFFGTLLVALTVAVFILALMRTTPWYYVAGYFALDNQLVNASNYYASEIADQHTDPVSAEDAQVISLQQSADELSAYIRQLRQELVDYYSDEEAQPVTEDGRIDVREMYKAGLSQRPYNLIVERDQNKLYDMLQDFRNRALELKPDTALEHLVRTDFSFNIPEPFEPDEWWEHCYTGPLFHSLALLASYENSVRLVERALVLKGLTAENTEQEITPAGDQEE